MTVSAAVAAQEPSRCRLHLVDDRAEVVEGVIDVCPAARACRSWSGATPLEVEVGMPLVLEGETHGPTEVRPEPASDESGTCTVSVPRKAELRFAAVKGADVEVSLYRPMAGSDLGRPTWSHRAESGKRYLLPAGAYIVSLSARGWAPDLHWLDAEPGSSHEVRYRRREGWSLALGIRDAEAETVADARVELTSVLGFGAPQDDGEGEPDATPTVLVRTRGNDHGIVLVSGLRAALVSASVEHPSFVPARLPALSSTAGTFRFFDVTLHPGGEVVARLSVEGEPAGHARCELTTPRTKRDLETEPVWRGVADGDGVCRARRVAAGHYNLRVEPDDRPARAVVPVTVADAQVTELDLEMRPMVVEGTVYLGETPAPGFGLRIARLSDHDVVDPEWLDRDVSDDEGRYRLVVWAAGEYFLQIPDADFRDVFVPSDGEVDFHLADFELRGRVVDGEGRPLPEATVAVRWSNRLLEVTRDDAGGFRCAFPTADGTAEVWARLAGYRPSDKVEVRMRPGVEPPPVVLELRRRSELRGRVTLASGRPLAGGWLMAYALAASPRQPPALVDRHVTDADGRFELAADDDTPLRLFYGGPGCPLAVRDLEPGAARDEVHLGCVSPAGVLLRVVPEGSLPRHGQTVLLRRGHVVVPSEVLDQHLSALGMPTATDGDGRLTLAALEPGSYDLFHGGVTSLWNLLAGFEDALLGSVHLGDGGIVQLEVRVALE